MIADRTAHHHHVSATDLVEAEAQAGSSEPDPRRREIEPAAFAAAQYFGIARRNSHAAISRRARHAGDQAIELRKFQAFLDEGIEGEIGRRGTGDGQIVNSPVHGE